MAAFKIPEKFWKWAFLTGALLFYLSSMLAIAKDKGIYSQAGAVLLAGVILLYFIFSNKR